MTPPPKRLTAVGRWLFKHPLGWLVTDLVGWVAFVAAWAALTIVGRWDVPMPVHNTILAVLSTGFLAALLALMFSWLDQRNAERIRAWAWWLNGETARHVARAVWDARQIETTARLYRLEPERQPVPAGGVDPTEAHWEGYMRGLRDRIEGDDSGADS